MESQLTIGSCFAKFVAEVVHSLDCTKGDVEFFLHVDVVSFQRSQMIGL